MVSATPSCATVCSQYDLVRQCAVCQQDWLVSHPLCVCVCVGVGVGVLVCACVYTQPCCQEGDVILVCSLSL